MNKIILCALMLSISLASPFCSYANKNQPSKTDQQTHRQDPKEILENQYQQLSQDERIRKIESLYNEHLKLSNSSRDNQVSNEIRNEIIWLLPNTLEADVVKSAYESNEVFENAVENALIKMKNGTKYQYNVKEKRIFGVQVAFVYDVNANNTGIQSSTRPSHNPNTQLQNQYQNLSNDERIKKIEPLYNEHMKYDNSTKYKTQVAEIRSEIIRLLPNSLEKDVIAVLYERNGLFERAVKDALEKLKDNKSLNSDVKEKKIFGGIITIN